MINYKKDINCDYSLYNKYNLIIDPLYLLYNDENYKYLLIDINKRSSISLSEEEYNEIKDNSEEELNLLFELKESL